MQKKTKPLSTGILCVENFRRELRQLPGKTPAERDDSHRALAFLSYSVALQIEYDRLAAPEVAAAAMMTIKHFSLMWRSQLHANSTCQALLEKAGWLSNLVICLTKTLEPALWRSKEKNKSSVVKMRQIQLSPMQSHTWDGHRCHSTSATGKSISTLLNPL